MSVISSAQKQGSWNDDTFSRQSSQPIESSGRNFLGQEAKQEAEEFHLEFTEPPLMKNNTIRLKPNSKSLINPTGNGHQTKTSLSNQRSREGQQQSKPRPSRSSLKSSNTSRLSKFIARSSKTGKTAKGYGYSPDKQSSSSVSNNLSQFAKKGHAPIENAELSSSSSLKSIEELSENQPVEEYGQIQKNTSMISQTSKQQSIRMIKMASPEQNKELDSIVSFDNLTQENKDDDIFPGIQQLKMGHPLDFRARTIKKSNDYHQTESPQFHLQSQASQKDSFMRSKALTLHQQMSSSQKMGPSLSRLTSEELNQPETFSANQRINLELAAFGQQQATSDSEQPSRLESIKINNENQEKESIPPSAADDSDEEEDHFYDFQEAVEELRSIVEQNKQPKLADVISKIYAYRETWPTDMLTLEDLFQKYNSYLFHLSDLLNNTKRVLGNAQIGSLLDKKAYTSLYISQAMQGVDLVNCIRKEIKWKLFQVKMTLVSTIAANLFFVCLLILHLVWKLDNLEDSSSKQEVLVNSSTLWLHCLCFFSQFVIALKISSAMERFSLDTIVLGRVTFISKPLLLLYYVCFIVGTSFILPDDDIKGFSTSDIVVENYFRFFQYMQLLLSLQFLATFNHHIKSRSVLALMFGLFFFGQVTFERIYILLSEEPLSWEVFLYRIIYLPIVLGLKYAMLEQFTRISSLEVDDQLFTQLELISSIDFKQAIISNEQLSEEDRRAMPLIEIDDNISATSGSKPSFVGSQNLSIAHHHSPAIIRSGDSSDLSSSDDDQLGMNPFDHLFENSMLMKVSHMRVNRKPSTKINGVERRKRNSDSQFQIQSKLQDEMNLDIVKYGSTFFESLPKANFVDTKCIRSDISNTSRNDSPHSAKLRKSKVPTGIANLGDPQFKRQNTAQQNRSVSFKAFRNNQVSRGYSADFRKNAMQFGKMTLFETETDILYHQVYEPYYISNATILLSGDTAKKNNKRFSLIDIIESFVKYQGISSCKMYFLHNQNRVQKLQSQNLTEKAKIISPKTSGVTNKRNKKQSINKQPSMKKRRRTGSMCSLERRPDTHSSEQQMPKRRRKSLGVVGFRESLTNTKGLSSFKNEPESDSLTDSSQSMSNSLTSSDDIESDEGPSKRRNARMLVHYKSFKKEKKAQVKNDSNLSYYEIELKRVSVKNHESSQSRSVSGHLNYERKQESNTSYCLVTVKDISLLIYNQKKENAKAYLDSFETHFSHEQMNPLNAILQSSALAYKRVDSLLNELHQLRLEVAASHNNQLHSPQSEMALTNSKEHMMQTQSLDLVRQIQQQAQALYYYNQIQIVRILIQKKEIKKHTDKFVYSPEKFIEDILETFTLLIEQKSLNVFVMRKNDFSNLKLGFDWQKYKLILFNLIQNAIKYNAKKGDILICLTCKPQQKDQSALESSIVEENINVSLMSSFKYLKQQNFSKSRDDFCEDNTYVLETEIIDTGEGIKANRQKMLFTPFKEVRAAGSIDQVKDFNIGMGLSASRTITDYMGGDIILKASTPGLTEFGFRVPVKTVKVEQSCNTEKHSSSSGATILKKFFGQNNEMSKTIKNYLVKNDIKNMAIEEAAPMQASNLFKRGTNRHSNMGLSNQNFGSVMSFVMPPTIRSDRQLQSPASQKQVNPSMFKRNSIRMPDHKSLFKPNGGIMNQRPVASVIKPPGLMSECSSTSQNDFSFDVRDSELNKVQSRMNLDAIINEESLSRVGSSEVLILSDSDEEIRITPKNQGRKLSLTKPLIERSSLKRGMTLGPDHFRQAMQRGSELSRSSKNGQGNKIFPRKTHLPVIKESRTKFAPIQDDIYAKYIGANFDNLQRNERFEIARHVLLNNQKNKLISKLYLESRRSKGGVIDTEEDSEATEGRVYDIEINEMLNLRSNLIERTRSYDEVSDEMLIIIKNGDQLDRKSSDPSKAVPRTQIQVFDQMQQQQQSANYRRIAEKNGNNTPYFNLLDTDMSHFPDFEDENLQPRPMSNDDKSNEQKRRSGSSESRVQRQMNDLFRCNTSREVVKSQLSESPKDSQAKSDHYIDIFKKKEEPNCVEEKKETYFNLNDKKKIDSNEAEPKETRDSKKHQQPQTLQQQSPVGFFPVQTQAQFNFHLAPQNPYQNYQFNVMAAPQQLQFVPQQMSPQHPYQAQIILPSPGMNIQPIGFPQGSGQTHLQRVSSTQIAPRGRAMPEKRLSSVMMAAQQPAIASSSEAYRPRLNPTRGAQATSINSLESSGRVSAADPSLQFLPQAPPQQQQPFKTEECDCEPKILVVDDASFNLVPIMMLLQEEFDIEPHTASNGKEAFDKYEELYNLGCGCSERTYRLIIMDIQMPVMDGIQSSKLITNLIKNGSGNSNAISDEDLTHIVGLSAYTNKLEECKRSGMKNLFNKPLTVKKLHRLMLEHFFRVSKEEQKQRMLERFGCQDSEVEQQE